MPKRLEALEDIILYLNANEPKGLYCENIEVIKKELKALEIIKKKWVDVGYLIVDVFNENKTLESYNSGLYEYFKLTQEEFDLLEEVLGK